MLFLLGFLVFAAACVGLVYFVLLQEPKQGGLSSSLGGGGSDLFSGRGVAGGLVRITVILAGIFIVLAVVLNHIRDL
jgi:preprotein translocase subunit SecG